MYANPKSRRFAQVALVTALFGALSVSHAQSVDEITELKKKQLIAEMKKGTVDERPNTVVVMQQPKVAPTPEAPKLAVPDFGVVSIAGKNPSSLASVIFEGNSRNIRVVVGDMTPSGWLVERITPSAVTFSHALPPENIKSSVTKTSVKDRKSAKTKAAPAVAETEVKYQRVVVGFGANPTPRTPAMNAMTAAPAAAQAVQFQGVPAVIPTAVLAK
jgi:hypothetical protein